MPNTQHPKTNTLDVKIINPLAYPNWDDLLEGTEGEVFSNSTAWVKILHESYGYTPLYFSIFEGNRLSALLPVFEVKSLMTGLRGVSIPFTDYSNPIIGDETKFTHLFNHIVEYGKNREWKHLELRNGVKHLRDAPFQKSYFGHILDLNHNEQWIYAGLMESTKRNVRKAVKEGVTAKFSHSADAIEKYYILHCITRKRQGIPPQPLTFFKKIHENIISRGAGFVVLGEYNNNVIAGAVFFQYGEKVSFKFGASEMKYQHVRANNLVMWEAIKHSCYNGYKSFCFGRTDMDNQGLRHFKSGWGSKENLICYYRYDLEKDTFLNKDEKIKPLYKKIFSKMPIPLLKMAGTLLYKHIG
jgi:hypothetical protein